LEGKNEDVLFERTGIYYTGIRFCDWAYGTRLYRPGGGGTSDQPIAIKQAKTLPDHAFVAEEGKIDRTVGKKLYILNEGTNTVYVEIDNHHLV
jgi:uncharacterized protein YdeI (BOF family)